MKNTVAALLIASLLLPLAQAAEDTVIYSNRDGSYTYAGQTYTLEQFPVQQVLDDHPLDSVTGTTVRIFPAEDGTIDELVAGVRPLARKFHKLGINIETRFAGQVIPYKFRKK